MTAKRKKSLIVYINADDMISHLCNVHPVKGIADDTTPYHYYENVVKRDEMTVVRLCKKMLYKAGCPRIAKGKTLKVRVTIEPIKERVR